MFQRRPTPKRTPVLISPEYVLAQVPSPYDVIESLSLASSESLANRSHISMSRVHLVATRKALL